MTNIFGTTLNVFETLRKKKLWNNFVGSEIMIQKLRYTFSKVEVEFLTIPKTGKNFVGIFHCAVYNIHICIRKMSSVEA